MEFRELAVLLELYRYAPQSVQRWAYGRIPGLQELTNLLNRDGSFALPCTERVTPPSPDGGP